MPLEITEILAGEVRGATNVLIEKDDNLADRWRHVETLLDGAASHSVNQLIAAGSPIVKGFVLPPHEIDDSLPDEIELSDHGLRGDKGAFEMLVPNADLRAVLWYMIDRKRIADEEDVPVAFVGTCQIPVAIEAAAAAIRGAYQSSAADEFESARAEIDRIAARALGLSDEELAYICERFESDPFLSQIRPMWAHRGLHVQGYQDHSGGDRFAN